MKNILSAALAAVTLGAASFAPMAPTRLAQRSLLASADLPLARLLAALWHNPRRPSITALRRPSMSNHPIAGASAARCLTNMAK